MEYKTQTLRSNIKPKINKNNYKYFLTVIIFILLIIISFTLLKNKKILNNRSTNQNDLVLIYDYTYNPNDGSKETEKVLQYNISNNSIKKLPFDGYEIIDHSLTYLPSNKNIFLIKDKQIFVYNISASKISKTSLPSLKEDKDYKENIYIVSFSKDQNSVIFQVNNYDKNDPGPEIGGGPSPLSNQEYIYNISENKTIISDISQKAKKLTENVEGGIVGWDSNKNILFVEYCPTSISCYDGSVFANLDLNKNTFIKTDRTIDSNYLLSPSYKQVAVLDTNKGKIFIYNTDNFNDIKKELDISQLKDYGFIISKAWSPNEEEIALGFDRYVYTININSGKLTQRYADNTIGGGYLYWSRNIIAYSLSKNFLFITDSDNTNQNDLEKGLNIDKTIKIDLATNKSEIINSTTLERETSDILSISSN